jgi:hypothetical protein
MHLLLEWVSFFYFVIFSSRYSFKATALLNLSSFVPYSKVIEFCSFANLMILSTASLSLFLSNSLKYLRLNSSHFFTSCPNHFLNELLGAMSFCQRSIPIFSLRKPRGHSLSTNILKLSTSFGLSYTLSILIVNSEGHVYFRRSQIKKVYATGS